MAKGILPLRKWFVVTYFQGFGLAISYFYVFKDIQEMVVLNVTVPVFGPQT